MQNYKFLKAAANYANRLSNLGKIPPTIIGLAILAKLLGWISLPTLAIILSIVLLGILIIALRVSLASHAIKLVALNEEFLRLKYPNIYKFPQGEWALRIHEFEEELEIKSEVLDEEHLWISYAEEKKDESQKGERKKRLSSLFSSEDELLRKVSEVRSKMVTETWKLREEFRKLGASRAEFGFLVWAFWMHHKQEDLEIFLNGGSRESSIINDLFELKETFLRKRELQ